MTEALLGGPLDAGLWEYKLELGLRYAVPIPAMLTPPEGVRGWAVPVPPLETTEFRDSERCKPTATKFKSYKPKTSSKTIATKNAIRKQNRLAFLCGFNEE